MAIVEQTGGTSAASVVTRREPDRTQRWIARSAHVALSLVWAIEVGLPVDRVTIFAWLWLTAVMWRWGVPLGEHVAFARDWWPMFTVLVFWTYSRGLADNLGIAAHVTPPVRIDRWLGFGELPSQRLQAALCGSTCGDIGSGHWYDTIFTATYLTHFVTGLTLGLVLWMRNRQVWLSWMRRYLLLNWVGLAMCVAYPMAPPWLASMNGLMTPRVERLTGRGGSVLGVHVSAMVMGPIGNDIAAMPSLHAGTACLVALFGVERLHRRGRWLLLLYPLTMGTTLVYYGEHYLIDVLVGYLLAIGVMVACRWWEAWRAPPARRTTGAATEPGWETA